MSDPNWQAIEALATVAAAILAGLALFQASRIFSQQQKQNKNIHEQQKLLAQRQLFLPLFELFKDINSINPTKPVWADVRNAVNFIDLLGVCWEGHLVDRDILFRVFREIVIETYENVQKCTNPPSNVPKDGPAMLRESRAATALYTHLMEEHFNRDQPKSNL